MCRLLRIVRYGTLVTVIFFMVNGVNHVANFKMELLATSNFCKLLGIVHYGILLQIDMVLNGQRLLSAFLLFQMICTKMFRYNIKMVPFL